MRAPIPNKTDARPGLGLDHGRDQPAIKSASVGKQKLTKPTAGSESRSRAVSRRAACGIVQMAHREGRQRPPRLSACKLDMTSITDRAPVLVDFALQGGGAHGAFTWGALDRLLEEPWLQIDGISGTSAGGMNSAPRVSGRPEGGGGVPRSALGGFVSRGFRATLCRPPQPWL